MRAHLPVFLLCGVVSLASAEERAYPVIDASGRIQMIRESGGTSAASKNAKKNESQEQAPGSSLPEPARQARGEDIGREEQVSKPDRTSPDLPYAKYDGDDYVDSEAMDNAHQSNEKQRFFIMNDGAGQRIENMSGASEDFSAPLAEIEADDFLQLKNSYVQLPAGIARNVEGGCLSEQQMRKAMPLSAGRMSDVVFDKRLSNYVSGGQLVEAYRIAGDGARMVSLRSYSRTDIEPSFVVPFVAFADAKGCIARVADGYFQRFYPETKTRHPLLEASLVMHSEDAYLLLVMPETGSTGNYKPEYRLSSVGRVSIKWQ